MEAAKAVGETQPMAVAPAAEEAAADVVEEDAE
jgi:hypothetical protein